MYISYIFYSFEAASCRIILLLTNFTNKRFNIDEKKSFSFLPFLPCPVHGQEVAVVMPRFCGKSSLRSWTLRPIVDADEVLTKKKSTKLVFVHLMQQEK
jgi:hypothetical protein